MRHKLEYCLENFPTSSPYTHFKIFTIHYHAGAASEEFQTQRPDIYENLSINTTKPVSNLYLFDTLLDIGSIQIDGFVNRYSLANKNFTPSDRYILNTSYKPLKYTKINFSAENSSTKR